MAKESLMQLVFWICFKHLPSEWKTPKTIHALDGLSHAAGEWFEGVTCRNLKSLGIVGQRMHRTIGSGHQQIKIPDAVIESLKSTVRQLKQGTTPQTEGLEFEENLTRRLRKEFPSDNHCQSPTFRRDQRACCFAPRSVGRPCHPDDHARSATQNAPSSRAEIKIDRIIGWLPSAARRRRCAPAPFPPSLRLRSTSSVRRPQTEAEAPIQHTGSDQQPYFSLQRVGLYLSNPIR